MKTNTYQWKVSDKIKYAVSLIPFLIGFIGTIYILSSISLYPVIAYVGLYIMLNIFQAGACTGCPYRGRYCPLIFGVYLGNIFSTILYRSRVLDMRAIKLQGGIAEWVLYIQLLFPVCWLFMVAWYYPLVYAGLMILHFVLFMPNQCEKCSYNDTCPGGIAWKKCKTFLHKNGDR